MNHRETKSYYFGLSLDPKGQISHRLAPVESIDFARKWIADVIAENRDKDPDIGNRCALVTFDWCLEGEPRWKDIEKLTRTAQKRIAEINKLPR